MPHYRSTPILITSLPRKHRLSLFVVEILYRPDQPLSLTLQNAPKRQLPHTRQLNPAHTKAKSSRQP
jgi:hypothetical protein